MTLVYFRVPNSAYARKNYMKPVPVFPQDGGDVSSLRAKACAVTERSLTSFPPTNKMELFTPEQFVH